MSIHRRKQHHFHFGIKWLYFINSPIITSQDTHLHFLILECSEGRTQGRTRIFFSTGPQFSLGWGWVNIFWNPFIYSCNCVFRDYKYIRDWNLNARIKENSCWKRKIFDIFALLFLNVSFSLTAILDVLNGKMALLRETPCAHRWQILWNSSVLQSCTQSPPSTWSAVVKLVRWWNRTWTLVQWWVVLVTICWSRSAQTRYEFVCVREGKFPHFQSSRLSPCWYTESDVLAMYLTFTLQTLVIIAPGAVHEVAWKFHCSGFIQLAQACRLYIKLSVINWTTIFMTLTPKQAFQVTWWSHVTNDVLGKLFAWYPLEISAI